jgi:aminoglycoside phosphotransferase (APT) family kinase protein
VGGEGARLIGAGREAQVFAWGDGRVLRLARDPAGAERVDDEAAALSAAARAGAPVPRPYERLDVDGLPGLVMERLDGDDLLARVQRRPWRARAVGRALGRIHARLHDVAAPEGVPSLRRRLAEALGSPLVPADVRPGAERQRAALPDGDRLCHGDFHPGNVIGSRVIDWTGASAGDPAADVARTCVLVAVAEPPGERPQWRRWLEGSFRLQLLDAYLRAYRRAHGLDLARVERWLPPVAAARLAEGIDPERDATMRLATAAGALRLPRRIALDAGQRRWIWLNALLVTALLNLVINAGIAWASAGKEAIPLWSAPLVGGPSTITDTVATLFLLPLITCVLVTTAIRRDLAAARLSPRVDLIYLLPRNRLLRGAALGAATVGALAPGAVALLLLADFGDLDPGAFVAYKACFAVALGAIVTPFIALAAMND